MEPKVDFRGSACFCQDHSYGSKCSGLAAKASKLTAFVIIMIIVLGLALYADAETSNNIGYRYYYNQLTDPQKQIYEFVLAAPHTDGQYTISFDCDVSGYTYEEFGNRMLDTKYACDWDNPEYTGWLDSFWLTAFDAEAGTATIEIRANIYYDEEDAEKVSEILDLIEQGADPEWDTYTKAKYIAETITSCMSYDMDYVFYDAGGKANSDKQHIVGLLNGMAVCEGYTELFKALADRLEVPCVEISSKGHAFVHICMEDGQWYGMEPQGKLILQGDSMYQGLWTESGWENIYEVYDGITNYLVQPRRSGPDYTYAYDEPAVTVADVEEIKQELNTGEPRFLYTVNDDGVSCTVTGYKGRQEGSLIVPDMIDGYVVTAIGNSAFAFCRYFAGNLQLPDSVEAIGAGAFAHCSGLTGDIVLPAELRTIENAAFISCDGFAGQIILTTNWKQ